MTGTLRLAFPIAVTDTVHFRSQGGPTRRLADGSVCVTKPKKSPLFSRYALQKTFSGGSRRLVALVSRQSKAAG